MDDILAEVLDMDEAAKRKDQVIGLINTGGFELHT